ncbi:MAG: restriction endonuclease subunit S [Bacteroidales bacterium]|nr:restriction endonuclease subunit S [Bacteroidales bacterium]
MEGLEIAEVFVSEPLNTELFRLEAEFYTANTFDLEKYFRGADIIDFVQYGTSEELNENFEGFPVLRLNEFDSLFIAKPSKYCKVIDKSTYNSLKLEKDDVLICRTNGNPKLVGKSALVTQSHEYAYASYLFKIRPKRKLINSATLVVFLNSKYGRLEIEKYSMASNQVNFSPAKFRELRIPDLGSNINQKIENIVYDAFGLLEKSKVLYQQAENILLETLGLKDIVLSCEPVNIKNFSESFLSTGRLDAEYYQKKYEDVIERIKRQKYSSLKELVQIRKSIEPGSEAYTEEGLPFLRVSDYNAFGINDPAKKLSNRFCKDNFDIIEKLKPKAGTILFSKDGSVGTAYLLRQNFEGITSGAILQLNINDLDFILPEYLTLVLNSKLVQMQAERDAGGSIILHWRINEIENVVVPIIKFDKQVKIAQLVEESFKLKQQSEQLLNVAKLAVELAIEEGQEKGLEIICKFESI